MSRRHAPTVHYRAGGRGPALVLLNGWSASGLAWPTRWVRALEAECRVIRIDNRGSGWSRFAATPFTMADLADDVVGVLDDADVERATVFGFSMGGMIAQELAIRAHDRVGGLVLAATAPPTPGHRPANGSSTALSLFRPPGPREALDVYFRKLWTAAAAEGFAERHPEIIEELVRQIVDRPTPRTLLFHQLRAVFGWGHADRLATIDAPTVVVHGAQDPLMTIGAGRRLAELIPDSRLVELDGVGHLVPHEAPDRTQELIRAVVHAQRSSREKLSHR